MQVSFDTSSPAEVSAVVSMLTALGAIKAAPVPAPSPFPTIPTPDQTGLPPIPSNAPAGSYWIKTPGAPSLHDAHGNVLAVDWTKNPPVVVPLPPRTPDGNSMSGSDYMKILSGNV